MSKFIVKVGDDTHEVDRDAIEVPDGQVLMTQDQFDATVKSAKAQVKKDNEELEKALRGQLSSDDEFFQSLAEKRGIQLNEELKPIAKLDPEKVQQIKEQVREEELKPVLEERNAFKEEAQQGRRATLTAQTVEALRKAGIREEMLENPFGTGPSAFVRDIVEEAQWDEDRKAHYFTDSSGNPLYNDSGDFAGPEKVADTLRKKDTDYRYFQDKRPGDSGFDRAGGGDSQRMTRGKFDQLPPKQQREFVTSGGEVVDA